MSPRTDHDGSGVTTTDHDWPVWPQNRSWRRASVAARRWPSWF